MKYIFNGLVSPKEVSFTLNNLRSRYNGLSVESDGEIIGEFDLDINDNEIIVTLEAVKPIDHNSNPNIETVKNIIDRLVRSFVDAYCFAYSYNYDIDIRTVECKKTGFNYQFTVIGERNIQGDQQQFIKILDTILTKRYQSIPLALSDFRRSIKYPSETANFCLRSLETIRRIHFDDPQKSGNEQDKDGWIKMGKTLGTKKSEVYNKMCEFAFENRHGRFPKITYVQRESFMNYTRDVITKFINWLSKQP